MPTRGRSTGLPPREVVLEGAVEVEGFSAEQWVGRVGRKRAHSDTGQILVGMGTGRPNGCPFRAKIARNWPNLGHTCHEIHRTRSVSALVWPKSAQSRPDVGEFDRIWPDWASRCATLVPERAVTNICESASTSTRHRQARPNWTDVDQTCSCSGRKKGWDICSRQTRHAPRRGAYPIEERRNRSTGHLGSATSSEVSCGTAVAAHGIAAGSPQPRNPWDRPCTWDRSSLRSVGPPQSMGSLRPMISPQPKVSMHPMEAP